MEFLRGAVLVLAALSMGLMAGVFGLYANTIMPGLRRTDDRTFVGAFQSIDRAIINPLFLATFVGPLVLSGLGVLLHLADDERSVLPWCAAAFVLYLLVFIITAAVNVPLNDGLKSAGDPDRHRRSGGRASPLRRSEVGPLERRPQRAVGRGVRLPALGTRRARSRSLKDGPRKGRGAVSSRS